MNTKVNKCIQLYNMQLHKAEAIVALIDTHLPKRSYTAEVLKRCAENGIPANQQIVIDVKLFRTKNIQVLDKILDIARENEKAQKKLEKLVTKN